MSMKNFTLALGFILLSYFVGSSQSLSNKDSLRIDQFVKRANELFKSRPDSAYALLSSAMQIAEQSNVLPEKASILQEIGTLKRNQGRFDTARIHFTSALEIYKKLNDSAGIAKSTNNIGTVYFFQGKFKKALTNYQQALRLFIKLGNAKGIADCHNNIGIIHWRQKNYKLAEEYYKKAAEDYTQLGNVLRVGYTYNNLGVIYGEQEEYLKSLDYYKKAADTFEDLGMRQFVTSSYQNIGIVYKNLGKYKLSMNYYEKALNIAQDLGDRNMVATIYSNLSELHFALADSTHGSAGQKRDHYAAGLQSGEKAISIAKDIGALPLINSMARSLINMHKKAGNLEKALQYTDLYIETQDSLFNKEKARAIEELEASYQAEKKQLRIDKLEQEKALQQARMRSQRILIIVFIGGILVILVFSFIIYRQYKQKQNAYKMVVAQNEEIQIQKESITQYAQELSRLNATKNKFFSIIAHDLKNPFNSLLGNSVLLKEKLESATKDELREFVDEIHSASERGYNLLLNLLEWSRAQTGRLNIDPQNIYLNDVVQQSIFLLQPNAKEKNITIENKLSEPVFVYADYNSTTTILRNLLANAIKYSGEGDVVTIYSKQENGYVKVIVEDQGMGIPKDKQDKLFQIDSAYSTPGTSDEKGTGLGLLLCKEFAEKNHGNIDFTSEEGKGSIFYFTLKEGSDNL